MILIPFINQYHKQYHKLFQDVYTKHMKYFPFIGKHLLFILFFTGIYYWLSHQATEHFGRPLTLFDSLYFSMITQTTIGFGDIVPTSDTAKSICMGQMLTLAGLLSYHI